jgi:thiamine pyrophosphokinase
MPAEEAVDTTPPEPTTRRAIVLGGGALHTRPDTEGAMLVIAADSGYDHAMGHGITVDLLIGDMDSISPDAMVAARAAGTTIERHPTDKDHSDLELAVRAALERGARAIEIHGADDGRIDHLLGVALGVTASVPDGVTVAWHTRTGTIRAASPAAPVRLRGSVGSIVSLVPAGDVVGVTTTGLEWSLDAEDLASGTTRGLSNIMTSSAASISVHAGHLLVVSEVTP